MPEIFLEKFQLPLSVLSVAIPEKVSKELSVLHILSGDLYVSFLLLNRGKITLDPEARMTVTVCTYHSLEEMNFLTITYSHTRT